MRVQLDHIVKIFGVLRANDDISMTLEEGKIYAILGENGAGKSTLMKILSGYQPATSGNIILDGQRSAFSSPADALRRGIGMLHQDPLDVAVMTVLDNFILGRPAAMIPDRRSARHDLVETCKRLGFNLNPDTHIDQLTIGERQQLEIARLISLGAKVLILDEPTTGISTEQKEALFNSLKRLASEEKLTVILVSHKLEDVKALCDAVIVLRSGKVVGERAMPCDVAELVALMFGQEIERSPRDLAIRERLVLQVRGLGLQARRVAVHDVDLDVRAGEVIGLAGLDGSGQEAFLRALAGLQPINAGSLTLTNAKAESLRLDKLDYHARVQRGICFAPAGRLEEGLVQGLTVAEHFALTMPAANAGSAWIDWSRVNQHADAQIAHYYIRGRADSNIETLSGGNQQRTLIALLPEDLKLLLLEDPTRGLDVESVRWVWSQLLDRRQHGAAILFTSPDLDEIIEYSDRVLVFYGGEVSTVDDPANISVTQLGSLIGGKRA
ncbi:MAG: ATP-binding cassette domain-containing protein [Anaerolineae bacterium]|nr:ATP-binding cassette domain-containing protein [Anaerolineae bacterium]